MDVKLGDKTIVQPDVHIFNDDCKIDFSEIKKELAEWASPEESED